MKLIFQILILVLVNTLFVNSQSLDLPAHILKKHNGPVKAIAYSADGQILASGGEDKMIYFWDVKTGELKGSIENYFAIRALQFTPGNLILAACGSDIKLMDQQGKLIRTFKGYTTDIWSLDYSPRLNMLIAGSYAKTIRVWNFETGALQFTLTGHEKSCLSVCIDQAGILAASGSLDKSVRLWDLGTGTSLKKLDIHSENIFAVDFHPSGKYLVSASADKTIRLWSVEGEKVIRTYTGHTGTVFDVRFSADGNHLISCGADKTIILWETATGRMLYTFTGHEASVNSVRFCPDGLSFASASDDITVRIWRLEKRYFVEPYFGKEIEESRLASPLFTPRRSDETKQAYALRELEANKYLNDLYDRYYIQYLRMIADIKLDEKTIKEDKP
jgi:WD40 repeat protein